MKGLKEQLNHYFAYEGKSSLDSISSTFTKDNLNTEKVFIQYSKALDNILLHYYDV